MKKTDDGPQEVNDLFCGQFVDRITRHGVPSAYLVDVQTFETLQRRIALLEGIARGKGN